MPELGSLLPSILTPPPGPQSKAMADRLRKVESRNITFLSERFPVFWESATGANVRDVDGNTYVDFTGAFGVTMAGHAHPHILNALKKQSADLVHGMGDVHPPKLKLELLERLAHLAPWEDARAVLASSGSEAVEIALKTAELATGKSGILSFQGGYHGLTLGSLAATERDDFRTPFRNRLYDSVAFAPFPQSEDVDVVLTEIKNLLSRNNELGDAIGSVIIEPIQGRAGVRIPPPGFLASLAELTRSAGAILIFDEILTGFGRTGTLFALEHDGVTPDLLCVGKALGGGLPLSACLASSEIMDAWPKSKGEALHTSTFLGHPLSCATALAFLEVLETESLVDQATLLGNRLLEGLRHTLAGVVPDVQDIRGRGLLIGIDLNKMDFKEYENTTTGTNNTTIGGAITASALTEGLIVLPAGADGKVIEITPPAVISEEQIGFGIECLAKIIKTGLAS